MNRFPSPELYSDLLANIASFFFRVASFIDNFPSVLIEQSLDFFPPSDRTEIEPMVIHLQKLFSKLSPIALQKASIGFAKLISQNRNKVKIEENIFQICVSLVKYLCQDPHILQLIQTQLSESKLKTERFNQIFQ